MLVRVRQKVQKMSLSKLNHLPAVNHLKKDPVIGKIVDEKIVFEWGESENLFVDIVENIIGQQLSGKAAGTIIKRFETLVTLPITPQKILKFSDQQLRDVGMSWAKVKYVKCLSEAVINKTLDLEKIKTLPDNEVIVQLTKVKGIGRWTAEMVLIFFLRRPDVFSLGDLGLRSAVSKLYKVDRNDLKKIEKISLGWKPYRSLASRYLWKSLD